MSRGAVLVIDDEEVIQDILKSLLTKEGYEADIFPDGEAALAQFRQRSYDAVICDLMLPGIDGLKVLEELRRIDPDCPSVMITAYATIETAIQAMKIGAYDYVTKPFKNDELLMLLDKCITQKRVMEENRALKRALAERYAFADIVGNHASMRRIFDLIEQVAPSRSTVLVEGESGTGKELVARAIHHHSQRASFPFVTVNSGSLPSDLLESNLFGHLRGSFTGAVANKKGLFEVADRGSIFFDEISNISLETQAKLLRVIQEREFMRLGGVETIKVDVRIIAATNVDLKRVVDAGRFREDLYYRLNVIKIDMPPLRDRAEDIPLLAQHFMEKYCRENEKPIMELSESALQLLLDYDWPGNVRELENVIERAVVLSRGEYIDESLFPDSLQPVQRNGVFTPSEDLPFRDRVLDYEKNLILDALAKAGGVQKKAAQLLKIKPTTLNEMIKRFGIELRRES
ncbi:MAG: sigma-54 dependent transcriptional regulator [Acidobacteriota bacterium]